MSIGFLYQMWDIQQNLAGGNVRTGQIFFKNCELSTAAQHAIDDDAGIGYQDYLPFNL